MGTLADTVEVADEGEDKGKVMSSTIEGAFKLSKSWVCSYAKADMGTATPELVSQYMNGPEVDTLSSL